MALKSINPADDSLLFEFPAMDRVRVSDIIGKAAAAQTAWRQTSFPERSELLQAAAALLEIEAKRFGRLITREMGKPWSESEAEVKKCAWVCRYYAENGADQLQPESVPTEFFESYIACRPLGVVLAVMPWNFPFWQVFRFAAPALMSGNGGLLKHSSNVSGCALMIEEIFRQAGFPENLFRTLLIGGERVKAVIDDPRVSAVTLTGSTPAGRSVASSAGAVLKKTVLELGGSDPYVVLADANLEAAVEACAFARFLNCGQSCIAAKRFIVEETVADRFVELLLEKISKLSMGDPLTDVNLGPMARRDLRDELHRQVLNSVKAGAKLLSGGKLAEGPGAYYPPTVLDNVRPGMAAFDEELFGPVAVVVRVADQQEALTLANQSEFGLGAAIFTGDEAKGRRLAEEELSAGCCFVNDFVRSDPRLPFGGIKSSGYGRELGSVGIKEFVNLKTVVVK